MEKSKFEFSTPTLTQFSFNINEEADLENFNEMPVNTGCSIKKYENDANVKLKIMVGAKDNITPFYVQIEMESNFRWGGLDEDKVDSLLKTNAPALILSYIRPLISNVTNSSKYPAYNLPFLDFTDNKPSDSIKTNLD